MSLSTLMKRGGLSAVATAKAAKVANEECDHAGRLAGLAGLALASPRGDETNRGAESAVTGERSAGPSEIVQDEKRGGDSPLRASACEEFPTAPGVYRP